MQSDVYESIWFKLCMIIDYVEFYSLINSLIKLEHDLRSHEYEKQNFAASCLTKLSIEWDFEFC